ncbi:MAG: hypothetical protein IJA65_04265 [Acholeplasmatales bacterium]|nr:hypothetical protein [Acholeplasmatales bacterium]
MKGLRIIGDYFLEYLIITLLLILSAILIIPFIPVFIGVISYFRRDLDARMLKDIFVPIKENLVIIIKFTIFELVLLSFSALNIYFMNTNLEVMNEFILFISYVGLIIGIIFLINAPIIILNMNVNLRQLLFNSIALIFGGFVNSLLAIAAVGVYVVAGILFPYLLLIGIYIVPFFVSKYTNQNLLKLKARKLKTTVEELTKKENQDDYFDEKGYINHSE